jgi:hypothetical protein
MTPLGLSLYLLILLLYISDDFTVVMKMIYINSVYRTIRYTILRPSRLAAMWLTTALTYWRCVALEDPLHNRSRCNSALCRKSIIAVYVLSFPVYLPLSLLCLHFHLLFTHVPSVDYFDDEKTIFLLLCLQH